MSAGDLLALALDAAGGPERWRSAREVTFDLATSGVAFRSKLRRPIRCRAAVATTGQRTVLDGFPSPGRRAVFEAGSVRIESAEGRVLGARDDPRPAVAFPAGVHTHSREQVLYLDERGLIRRDDYTAEVFGSWARAAHYCHDHRDFGGLVVPTRRAVYPRGPDNRPRRGPLLVWIRVDGVRLEPGAAG